MLMKIVWIVELASTHLAISMLWSEYFIQRIQIWLIVLFH